MNNYSRNPDDNQSSIKKRVWSRELSSSSSSSEKDLNNKAEAE